MSYLPSHETVGPSRTDTLHVRKPGCFKTLCRADVPTDWFAWSIELFASTEEARRCQACREQLGFKAAA